MSDKKIELIAQLLNKAESTTPAEAEALTEHAERLMVKYGIEQAMIDARRSSSGQASEKIVQISILFVGAYRLEHTHLGHMVAKGLGNIECLASTYKNKESRLYLIGYKSDVEQARILISSLLIQSAVATRVWWNGHKSEFADRRSYDQEAARRSFVRGFGTGAGARIAASREQAVKESGTGTELVLVSRGQRVTEHYASLSKGTSKARGGKGDYSASVQGYRAGQQASTGEKAMTQGRGISA